MNLLEAVLFGGVEGLTEFLPVSSTGHLTLLERLLGFSTDAADVTAFTAIIQVGAVLATLIYFRDDFRRIVFALVRGLLRPGWAVVLGSVPIGVVGLLFKDQIETGLRSLWLVAGALVLWSGPMLYADRTATQKRREDEVTWKDTLVIGLTQCLALVPGVSRSGATMSAGLLRGLDRVAVTRLSFFLSVPALTAAGVLQAATEADAISAGVGWPATLLATGVSFAVAYSSIAWLLRYVARHRFTVFIGYRVALGSVLLGLLASGVVAATCRPGREVTSRYTSTTFGKRSCSSAAIRSVESSTPAASSSSSMSSLAARSTASGPTSMVRTSTTRATSGWPASAPRIAVRSRAGADSPISISLVSRPSRYATTASSTPIAMAAPASQ